MNDFILLHVWKENGDVCSQIVGEYSDLNRALFEKEVRSEVLDQDEKYEVYKRVTEKDY